MTPRVIVVPLDGSDFAELALPHAAHIARGGAARLHLVTVVDMWPPITTTPMHPPTLPVTPPVDFQAIARTRREYVDRVAVRARMLSNSDVETDVIEGHTVADALQHYVVERAGGLVVMTTHGAGRLRRLWLGSVADALTRKVEAPVLLVKESASPRHDDPAFRRVVIGLDGSALAEASIDAVTGIVAADRPELLLVRVTGPVTAIAAANLAERLDDQAAGAGIYLDERAERLRQAGWRVTTETKVHTSAARALIEAAEDVQADLIAIATHGHGGLRRLMRGSVADAVIRHASTRVFVATAAPPP